jgi:putative endonuclease
MPDSLWSLYVIRTASDTLYAGISNDVNKRFQTHQQGKGARYLKGKGPLELVYCVSLGDKSLSLKAEYAFKQLSRSDKLKIINGRPNKERLLSLLELSA